MALQIYNSMTKQKQPFVPLHENAVKMYVCGVTVYDHCHVGHARSYLVFDAVVRYLMAKGYTVTYVRNITDIDDKIIARAQAQQITTDQLVEQSIAAFHRDTRDLNLLPPAVEPRATDYIAAIIALIETLQARGYAYVASSGEVLFDVRRFKSYGQLSRRSLEAVKGAARVLAAVDKRDDLDFVLWKPAKPGEPKWPSPWGEGRPGWHIECSAMAKAVLGQPFDIHGGGLDLKFPHHENEIAQSEAAYEETFAQLWMHAGLLQINDEKMSKSLNNFITIRQALAQVEPEVLRFFMLSAHYRSPLNYTDAHLVQAKKGLDTWYTALRGLSLSPVTLDRIDNDFVERFYQAMDDDFNTPEAYAVLFDLAHAINRLRDQEQLSEAGQAASVLCALAGVLGLLQQDPEAYFTQDVDVAAVESMLDQRQQARQQKDWAKADQIRQQLLSMGVHIEDTATGTSWRKV